MSFEATSGDFTDKVPVTRNCRKCGDVPREQLCETWDSSCGGYTDYRYKCLTCGGYEWVDGCDS